jgi:hypothetical protein
MPLEIKRRQKFTRIAAMRIIFTRICCTLLTCDMYMSDLRYIHDPVLSSLKMEGILLLFVAFSYLPTNSTLDKVMGRVSSVGIATHYGQDGLRIESRWGRGEILRTRPDHSYGPPSLLYNGYRVISQE